MVRRGREEDRNQIVAIRFYDFECTKNTLDAETDRPIHKVNDCFAINACDKCRYDHPCDDKINKEAVFMAHKGSNYD